ncbi:MAG: SDR family oxidoreductase [Verrucomicrobia bacterium]|nr:SDR family oxidoreductase [Verrucomicrobiota bacterium]
MLAAMRVLIVGCGYVGFPLGAELARLGHEVFGLRRSAEGAAGLAAAGVTPLTGDITNPAALARLPGPFDWVVDAVSSSRGDAEAYRRVFLDGTRHLLDALADAPPRKFVFTSSTSVYAQSDGSTVDESAATEPTSETGRVLVQAEQMVMQAWRVRKFPAVVLRLAGIYGPGRGHLFKQFLSGEARIEGDGARFINMVHVEDAAGAVMTALERAQPGGVYNVADDAPVSERAFFEWIAGELGRAMPPAAAEAGRVPRKRAVTHKRVSNAKLKSAGWRLKFPTFREGYAREIGTHRDTESRQPIR